MAKKQELELFQPIRLEAVAWRWKPKNTEKWTLTQTKPLWFGHDDYEFESLGVIKEHE